MKTTLKLGTFVLGEPPTRNAGIRISATRRPPRGVPRTEWLRRGLFDAWLPILGPSKELAERFRGRPYDAATMRNFLDCYEREVLGSAESRQTIDFLALLAMRVPISVGCFCPVEELCHRSRLRELIEQAAARIRRETAS